MSAIQSLVPFCPRIVLCFKRGQYHRLVARCRVATCKSFLECPRDVQRRKSLTPSRLGEVSLGGRLIPQTCGGMCSFHFILEIPKTSCNTVAKNPNTRRSTKNRLTVPEVLRQEKLKFCFSPFDEAVSGQKNNPMNRVERGHARVFPDARGFVHRWCEDKTGTRV